MENIKAAGLPPAAGTLVACDSESIQSAKKTMTSQTTITPGSTATADFTKIHDVTWGLARKLGIEIVGCAKGFNAYKGGEIISPDCDPDQILCWLDGYEEGKDDLQVVEQIEQVPLLLAELGRAEIVIQALLAQMSDRKRASAEGALQVAGFAFGDAFRMKARQAVSSAARSALAEVAAAEGAV